MTSRSALRLAVAFAALAWLSGCVAAGDSDLDDIAVAVGALVGNEDGGEVGSMGDCEEIAAGEVPAGLTASGDGSFEGPRGGLTYAYTVTCEDESGSPLGACDATTDTARYTVAWSGEIDLPRIGYWASVSRTGSWTLTGIQSAATTLGGSGSFEMESEFEAIYRPVTRNFALQYDAEYDEVVIGPLGVVQSGEITYEVHAQRRREGRYGTTERELDVQVVVTFLGAGAATLVVDADRAYDLDLDTGEVTAQ
jgi:hypothetical protein